MQATCTPPDQTAPWFEAFADQTFKRLSKASLGHPQHPNRLTQDPSQDPWDITPKLLFES